MEAGAFAMHRFRRIEGLGTKTDVLLASDTPIVEIDELRSLIADGHDRGYLTFEQISTTLEEVEVTKEQVAELHSYLEEQGIDVVARGRPARPSRDGGAARTRAAGAPRRRPTRRASPRST